MTAYSLGNLCMLHTIPRRKRSFFINTIFLRLFIPSKGSIRTYNFGGDSRNRNILLNNILIDDCICTNGNIVCNRDPSQNNCTHTNDYMISKSWSPIIPPACNNGCIDMKRTILSQTSFAVDQNRTNMHYF